MIFRNVAIRVAMKETQSNSISQRDKPNINILLSLEFAAQFSEGEFAKTVCGETRLHMRQELFERAHTTSRGQCGNASRNALPYVLLRIRLSRMTIIPSSVLVRIKRPTPCRNFRIASGSEYS